MAAGLQEQRIGDDGGDGGKCQRPCPSGYEAKSASPDRALHRIQS
jgi:hypothetical protein